MTEDENLAQLFHEIETHLLQDEVPSEYLKEIFHSSVFRQYPFSMIWRLKTTEQSPKHHPEGDVWTHTLMVVDQAAKVKALSKDRRIFMWSAFLHDIGKPAVTKSKKGRITAYGHDKKGAKLAAEFLSVFTDDRDFVHHVSALVRYHMHILFVVKELPLADIKGMKQRTDIGEVALLGLCDRIGRGKSSRKTEEKNIINFMEKCNTSIEVMEMVKAGMKYVGNGEAEKGK